MPPFADAGKKRIESGRVRVVFVHGTWAGPKRRWWQVFSSPARADLAFTERLRAALPLGVDIEAWEWSGRNSFRHRGQAAKDLYAHLVECRTSHPECRIYAIGHSHGGSVIAYLLKQFEQNGLAGAAFLSTPFVALRLRPQWQGILGALILSMVLVMPLLVRTVEAVGTSIADALKMGEWLNGWLSEALSSLSWGLVAVTGLSFYAWTLSSRAGSVQIFGDKLTDFCQRWETIRLPESNYLFIRSTGDEAASYLSAAQFWNRILGFLNALYSEIMSRIWMAFGLSGRPLLLISVIAPLAGFVAYLFFYMFFRFLPYIGEMLTAEVMFRILNDVTSAFLETPIKATLVLIAILLFMLLVFTVISGLLLLALWMVAASVAALTLVSFGKWLFASSPLIDVAVEPLPFGGHVLHHLPWGGQTLFALAHSATHENPESAWLIARWLGALEGWLEAGG